MRWSILNAKHHGTPQNRPRLWVDCIRKDTLLGSATFDMPEPLPERLRLTLSDILNPPSAGQDPRTLPRAQDAAVNVSRALAKAEQRGIRGDWFFPRDSVTVGKPRLHRAPSCRAFLHSNKQGYWLGSRGRHALVEEHARAQGLEASRSTWPKDSVAFALLGNSMARSILQRLVHSVLCAWGIFSGPDSWESSIWAEAARRSLPPPLKAPLAPHAGAAWARLMQALESPSRGGDQPRLAAAHLTEQAMTQEVASPRLVAAGTCPVGGGCGGS